ncbi:MAG TPA: cysteine desulfurase family protein [Acidimicrobiia bacterium]|nr:cysteine desulfurase family protein [Acidimicrobiia bacterium]
MTRAYLDHASSSPLRPVALAAMLPYLEGHPADPGRVHSDGRVTRVAVEDARAQVAALVGARPREVVFTATGTEAVNTAVWGAVTRGAERSTARGHVVTTAVEHSAVLESCHRSAADVTVVGVDTFGRFDADAVLAACRPDTVLISVQLANHEVGTIQTALPDIVAGARSRDLLVHIDACAAAGHVPLDFRAVDADLCSITGHKLGGPKGAAALLIRRGVRVPPLIVGGAQERARRAGIEDVPAIVGFGAAAAELMTDDRLEAEAAAARAQTADLLSAALAVPGVTQLGDPEARLPHLVCLAIAGVEAEPVLLGLDQHGVAVHSGSSCSSETLEPSPVLAAMGVDADRSLRPSVGWDTTPTDVAAFGAAFSEVVGKLRALGRG